jgi:hypothetical protein
VQDISASRDDLGRGPTGNETARCGVNELVCSKVTRVK